jgi:flotillin
VVWENGGHNGTTNTASFLQGMARTLPPMMQVLKDIGGVELPDSLIKLGQSEGAADVSANGAHAKDEAPSAPVS